MLNKTFFEPFAEECNVSLDDLKTIEGIVDVNDEAFQDWYSSFTKEINAAMNG